MTIIERKCFKKLDLYENITTNPLIWFKRNKMWAFIFIVCLILNLPIWLAAKSLMIICFIPHAIYEKLEKYT